MSTALVAALLVVAVVVIVGLFGHLLLLAGIGVGGYLVGRAHGEGKLALGRRKARGSLGR